MNPLRGLTICLFICLTPLSAQARREVVRDSSGRVVQTIERRTGTGGTVHTVIRDASGRLAGTSTRWRRRVRHRLPRRKRTALRVGDETEQWIRILPNELPRRAGTQLWQLGDAEDRHPEPDTVAGRLRPERWHCHYQLLSVRNHDFSAT